MDIQTILNIAEIIVVIGLIVTILLQQKGSGLGSAFGGGDNVYATKRGAEKFIYYSSIVLAVLFLGLDIVGFLIQK